MTIFRSPDPDITLRGLSVTERIFEGLADDPDRVVMTDGPSRRQLTAGALKDGIKRLAGGLNAAGLGQGVVTALMAPNIPEYAIVFHGVAFAGGTVTTINPTYTAAEARHQLADAGAQLLITVPMFLETARTAAEGTGVTQIAVIGQAEGAVGLDDLMGPPQAAQTSIDTAAHVVVLPYSSGTTGMPKGVMLSHDNLVANVDQAAPRTAVQPGETTIAFLPFFHIYGMTVLLNLYLSEGGALITLPRFDLTAFLQMAQDHNVRQLWVVPPVALALAKHPLVNDFDLSAVTRVFSGAAPLGSEVTDAIKARLGCDAMQGFGMTELSPVSHASGSGDFRDGASGRALAGTSCRIVSEDGHDLGPGEEGELWISGPQVMLGYLNNAQATAETIVDGGWLRTGDLAMVDDDGYLFLRDRVKELIKVKGFQVAPAELEAVLMGHPGIADAAVIGVPDDEAGERPVAFIVAAPEAEIDEATVKAHLTGQLSTYKQIKSATFVDAIPKSASGKILRRVLRDKISG